MKAFKPTLLIAPACYKGTLSAWEATEIIAVGLRGAFGDTVALTHCPIADGGDDSLAVLQRVLLEVTLKTITVTGPIAEMRVQAQYLWDSATGTVIIESAQAHGLKLLGNSLQPLAATSYGVGELIRMAALECQPETIVVTVGGSASTDGGLGALQALGLRCWDAQNQEILTPIGGGDLQRIARLRWPEVSCFQGQLLIATDVRNPLLGPQGAATVFAPQKGASPEQCQWLGRGVEHIAHLLKAHLGSDFSELPGTGAAGGLAFGLSHWPGARLISGSEWIAQALSLPEKVAAADVIITGEGRFDTTSLGGKATGQLLKLAQDKPVFLFPGQLEANLALEPSVHCFPLALDPEMAQSAMVESKQALQAALNQALPVLKNQLPSG